MWAVVMGKWVRCSSHYHTTILREALVLSFGRFQIVYVTEEKKPDHGKIPQMGASWAQGSGFTGRGLLSRRGGVFLGC